MALCIDLGLKTFAGFSDERLPSVEAQRFYRDLEPALATAQRARTKNRVKAIHVRIANRRKDFLHQPSTRLAREYGAILVGNVNASALAKGLHSKSVLDVPDTLRYKCADAGAGSMRSMMRFPPKPARAVVLARSRKVSQVLESGSGRVAIGGRYLIVIAMLPGTFSRSDVAVSLEESPPFPRKRQSFTTEGGEEVNIRVTWQIWALPCHTAISNVLVHFYCRIQV